MVRICITYVSTPSYTSSKWSTQKLFFWRAETQTIHAPAAKLPKHIALKKALLEIGWVVKLNQNMRKISKLHMFEMIGQKHNITMAQIFQCNSTYPDSRVSLRDFCRQFTLTDFQSFSFSGPSQSIPIPQDVKYVKELASWPKIPSYWCTPIHLTSMRQRLSWW